MVSRQSVVARLTFALVAGGIVISCGLSAIELWRNEADLQSQITGRVAVSVRNLQSVLRGVLVAGSDRDTQNVLGYFLSGSSIRAVRVEVPGRDKVNAGPWPEKTQDTQLWPLAEEGMTTGQEVDLNRLTIVRAPFNHRTLGTVNLELLIDGPKVRQDQRSAVLKDVSILWLFLAVMTLIGLMLARQWFIGPLSEVVKLASIGIGPEPFFRLSNQMQGEFSQLCQAIGGMLKRLENATRELAARERAMADLYQMAPAAMLSVDTAGKVLEANQRAAESLGRHQPAMLIGKDVLAIIRSEDRAQLRQCINRLDLDAQARCVVRVDVNNKTSELAVDCVAVRDTEGKLSRVRLSLQDVTDANAMRRDLEDKGRLLNLVLDHMSEAIVLVDGQGNVAAVNQRLAALLGTRTDVLMGQPYDAHTFWEPMGALDSERTIARLRQIEADRARPAQERVEARGGVFVFEGIPVLESADKPVGRLWVVHETTAQEQNDRLLEHQSAQLDALSRLGQQLVDVRQVDDVLTRSSDLLHEIFGVEAVGLALRNHQTGGRSIQMLHRGTGPYLLESSRGVVDAVERHLMPAVLASEKLMAWPDLPASAPFAKAFGQAGLTSIAGAPLRGAGQTRGILWIARRGGEKLERHHSHWLETLAPMIAATLEVAQLREHLATLDLTDRVTDLPNRRHFDLMVRRLVNRPGYAWSVLAIDVDRFRQLNDRIGHEAADAVLERLARAIQRVVRPSTFVARLGGNTFALLVPESTVEQTKGLAKRVTAVITEQVVTLPDGKNWKLTARAGIAGSPDDSHLGQGVIDQALARLEAAREAAPGPLTTRSKSASKQAG